MVLHTRLRGADSFHLLDSGLIGISRATMEQDAATGWLGESSINTIFSASDKHLLIGNEPLPSTYYSTGNYSGGSVIWIDGVESNIDKGGAIFSGAYSISKGKLDVL